MWVRVEGKIGVMKAKRHWPRKVESAYNDDDSDEGGDFQLSIREKKKPSTQDSGDNPRLRRLAQTRIDADEIWGEEILDSRRVERMAADKEEEDDEALAERRRKIKEKILLQQEEAAAAEESESESEYEYESDQSDLVEEMELGKPVFVWKSDRDTIAVKAEEQAREVETMLKILKRKRETREIVFQKIKDDFEIQKYMDDIIGGDADDDDDVNEEESYTTWKAREIARVKRDRRS